LCEDRVKPGIQKVEDLTMESPDVFWLNVTNAALGLGFLACLGMIVFGIVQDFAQRFRHHGPRPH
jgi:hypothetical protein